MKLPYKLPTIVRSKSGDWFVKYFYEWPDRPGEYKAFYVRDGINYLHNPEEKEKAILQLQKDIKNALEKLNFNPFNQAVSVKKQIADKEDQFIIEDAGSDRWTLEAGLKAFTKYCKWKKLSERTIDTYQTYINNFKEWLEETDQMNAVASEFLESSLLTFSDTYFDAEDWTARTYNNHISFFTTLFSRMETLERKTDRSIKYHIYLKDLELKTDKAEKNRAYSGLVGDRVKKELKKSEYFRLNQLITFIYLSCMRPKEIRLLQIQHIDLANKQIKVAGPTGKTGDRFVPISEELGSLLIELDLSNEPLNNYLFGNGGQTSEHPAGKALYSRIYLKIKKELGLDKNYTMYGWKHTRVIDLINAGFSDTEIMQLTGHKDYQSFLAYKRDLVVNTTVMTGKTVSF